MSGRHLRADICTDHGQANAWPENLGRGGTMGAPRRFLSNEPSLNLWCSVNCNWLTWAPVKFQCYSSSFWIDETQAWASARWVDYLYKWEIRRQICAPFPHNQTSLRSPLKFIKIHQFPSFPSFDTVNTFKSFAHLQSIPFTHHPLSFGISFFSRVKTWAVQYENSKYLRGAMQMSVATCDQPPLCLRSDDLWPG